MSILQLTYGFIVRNVVLVYSAAKQATTSTSIPSRYRTVVYSNAEPKGFNSKVTRFPAPEIVS